MKTSWWNRSVRRRKSRGNKSPHRKADRRLTFERMEPKVLLTGTVDVQPQRTVARAEIFN